MNTRVQIGPYVLRGSGEQDRALLTQWIDTDSYHCSRTDADFFLREEIGSRECFALEDGLGCVRFYLVMTVKGANEVLWMDIQFPPVKTIEERQDLREALTAGFAWLERRGAAMGFQAIGFESEAPLLIAFCRKRLGFLTTKRSNAAVRLLKELRHVHVANTPYVPQEKAMRA